MSFKMIKKLTLKYTSVLVFVLLLCSTFGFAQSSSSGNTFIFGNGRAAVHARNHSFLNAGSGILRSYTVKQLLKLNA